MRKKIYEKAVMNVREFKGGVSDVILTSNNTGGKGGAGGGTGQDDGTFSAKGFIGGSFDEGDFWS